MIMYKRSEWYGLMYLFKLHGSLMPKASLPALVAAGLNLLIHFFGKSEDSEILGYPMMEWLNEAYGMQLLGIVFGYLCVTRINMSYARYWEGVTHVKTMHSKWADACGQVLIFDRMLDASCEIKNEAFCRHIVRLFSQLSAMATMRLHVTEAEEALDLHSVRATSTEEANRGTINLGLRSGNIGDTVINTGNKKTFAIIGGGQAPEMGSPEHRRALPGRSMTRQLGLPSAKVAEAPAGGGGAAGASGRQPITPGGEASTPGRAPPGRRGSILRSSSSRRNSHTELDSLQKQRLETCKNAGLQTDELAEAAKKTADEKKDALAQGLTKAELTLLEAAPCPVLATAMRIQRSIITRHAAGGVRAPPPIVSRIFQEISNGILAYNNATKLKEIPVPFGYVQFNALFLFLFQLLSPLAVACFTSQSPLLSSILSFFVVFAFTAIWLVANEMEDPFGSQANDMPMLSYHEEFCSSIAAMLLHPWLDKDQWIVAEGKWVSPKALGGVFAPPRLKKRCPTSLLDKSKAANTSAGGRWLKALQLRGQPDAAATASATRRGARWRAACPVAFLDTGPIEEDGSLGKDGSPGKGGFRPRRKLTASQAALQMQRHARGRLVRMSTRKRILRSNTNGSGDLVQDLASG